MVERDHEPIADGVSVMPSCFASIPMAPGDASVGSSRTLPRKRAVQGCTAKPRHMGGAAMSADQSGRCHPGGKTSRCTAALWWSLSEETGMSPTSLYGNLGMASAPPTTARQSSFHRDCQSPSRLSRCSSPCRHGFPRRKARPVERPAAEWERLSENRRLPARRPRRGQGKSHARTSVFWKKNQRNHLRFSCPGEKSARFVHLGFPGR